MKKRSCFQPTVSSSWASTRKIYDRVVLVLLRMTCLTLHHTLQVHPRGCTWQDASFPAAGGSPARVDSTPPSPVRLSGGLQAAALARRLSTSLQRPGVHRASNLWVCLLGKYPVLGPLDWMVFPCFIFRGTPMRCPQWSQQSTLPPAVHRGPSLYIVASAC